MKNILLAASAIALGLGALPAAADKLDDIKAAGKLNMGVAIEPPYSALGADGKLTGADPDVARAIFSELGDIDLNANVVDWGALIPGLMADRFDAVATGLFIRPERCEAVIFSQPVLCNSEAFIVREGNPKAILTFKDIVESDIVISTVAGAEESRARELGMPDNRIMLVPDVFAAVDLLKSGRVDLIAFPDVTLIEAMKSLPEAEYDLITGIEGEPIQCSATAFNPDQKELRDWYDSGLVKLKESGKYAEILTSYGFDPTVSDKITRTDLCGTEN